MALPGALACFRLLLRSRLFLRSGMGFGGCFSDLGLLEGDFHEHVIQPLLRSTPRMVGMARYLRGLKWGPVDALEQAHSRITMPVQLIWGADDPTFPVEYARRMVKQLPDARHEEKPADVARAALDFLR
jgi:haloalkane dehalogenase